MITHANGERASDLLVAAHRSAQARLPRAKALRNVLVHGQFLLEAGRNSLRMDEMHKKDSWALLALPSLVGLLAGALTACAAPPAVAPVSAGAGVPRITPVPDVYACGDRIFKVAFEEGVAYVTAPDAPMLALPRLRPPGGADPEAPRLFTNGRISFTQEIEGGRAVRYAAGRAAFVDCRRLP